jgi:hypothetical protein
VAVNAKVTDRDGAMTDISLQKTATTAKRSRGRPFAKGQSGNPAGRPRDSTNRSTPAAQLLLDDEATALTGKAVDSAADILGAIKAVGDAVGGGDITPGEGLALSQMIESFLRAIDASDFDNRVRQLEEAQSASREDPYGYTAR